MDYLDFELQIDHGQGREYPVLVLRSPAGEAHETMRFPYDDLALTNRLQALQIALLRSGGNRRIAPTNEEKTVQEFGRDLFNALFVGEIRNRYDVSQERAKQQGKGLRLKLRIQSPELAALPWEFLYDPRNDYLSLSISTLIIRYIELPQPIQPLTITPPLRVLGMIASPINLPALDVGRERQRIENALTDLHGAVELKWIEGQTWRDLQRALRQNTWHIFHFIGHGGFDPNVDEGFVSFADDNGREDRFNARRLATLLADHPSMRLAVLNACEGAHASQRDIFSSTASILVRRGLSAVLAMQYEITDSAAIEFARTFYDSLADSFPVDAAVTEARKAISLSVTNTIEWGTPVLFMRSPDGMLFDLRPQSIARNKTDTEQLANEQAKQERLVHEGADRIEKEKAEQDRIVHKKAEMERLAKEEIGSEGFAKGKVGRKRLAHEGAKAKHLDQDKIESGRLAKEEAEQSRIAREKAEAERLAQQNLEAERIAKEKAEQERLAREKLETERLAWQKLEAERIAKEKAESARLAREKLEAERATKEKAEQDRLAHEKLEAKRLAREKIEAERIAKEKAEQERLVRQKLEAEHLSRQKIEMERAAKEKAEQEYPVLEKAEGIPESGSTSIQDLQDVPESDSVKFFVGLLMVVVLISTILLCYLSFLSYRSFAAPTSIRTLQLTITQTPTASPTLTLIPPTATSTHTPQPPTKTPTPTTTPTPTPQVSKIDGMTILYVPAGSFTMGSDTGDIDERPAHVVELDAFWIDKTEVTNAMYVLCVKAGKCPQPLSLKSYKRDSYFGDSQFDNYPVIYVTWANANAYCKWAGRRLPSEAEWEKAARGMDGRAYPWGNAVPDQNKLNYSQNVGDTTEVGKYPSGASVYGALDMAGNVWEWVTDWYDETYYSKSPSQNPTGPISGIYHVRRGGAWNNFGISDVRALGRDRDAPLLIYDGFGFRCASSP